MNFKKINLKPVDYTFNTKKNIKIYQNFISRQKEKFFYSK